MTSSTDDPLSTIPFTKSDDTKDDEKDWNEALKCSIEASIPLFHESSSFSAEPSDSLRAVLSVFRAMSYWLIRALITLP